MTTAALKTGAPVRLGVAALAAVVSLIVGLPVIALVSLAGADGSSAAAGAPMTDAAALDAWMRDVVPDSPLVGLGSVFVAGGGADLNKLLAQGD